MLHITRHCVNGILTRKANCREIVSISLLHYEVYTMMLVRYIADMSNYTKKIPSVHVFHHSHLFNCPFCRFSGFVYKKCQISNIRSLKSQNLYVSFSSRRAVVIAQSIEARGYVKNEDVVGATPTGDAPTTSD